MKNKSVYILGPDGSGKTTLLKDIESDFSHSHSTRHIWIRSPKITSKPLMGICRLFGLTEYYKINDVIYGKHEFWKSKLVTWIYPKLQLLDFKIKWFLVKSKIDENEVVLFDRFCLDTLADVMVSTRQFNLHETFIGKSFIRMIPKNSRVLFLSVDEGVIRQRKKDTLYDEKLSDKIRVYDILHKNLNYPKFYNNGEYSELKKQVLYHLSK